MLLPRAVTKAGQAWCCHAAGGSWWLLMSGRAERRREAELGQADATKQRQNLDSWKDSYLFVFLIYRMVEEVTFHWECWRNLSSTWKIFFILTLKQNNVLSLLDVISFFKINSWIIEWWRKALSETGKKNRIHLMFIMSLDYFRRVVTFQVSQTELKLNTYTWQPDPKFGHWGWHRSHSLA